MAMLLRRITEHVGIKNKVVGGIKELEDEIIHFQHIKVIDMGEDLTHLLEEKIRQVKDFEQIDKKQLASDFAADLITEAEFLRLLKAEAATSFKDLEIVKMAQHYYVPLIYSKKRKKLNMSGGL